MSIGDSTNAPGFSRSHRPRGFAQHSFRLLSFHGAPKGIDYGRQGSEAGPLDVPPNHELRTRLPLSGRCRHRSASTLGCHKGDGYAGRWEYALFPVDGNPVNGSPVDGAPVYG